jgi:chromosome transmission fidelity protein 1
MSSENSSRDYPTGSTVPFPYEYPYPQQVDLMDALLSSLTTTSKIMLLESPTGTGKSLSLACSAMTWLRYREQSDLKQAATKETTTNDRDDWLNDWVAPEERELQHQETAVRERAQTARQALQQQLQGIQSKLSEKNNNRERRENLVRSAVTAAKMRERQGRFNKKKKRIKQQVQEDYCVADYRSDQEEQEDCNDSDEENVDTTLTSASQLLEGAALDGSSAVYGKTSLGDAQPGSGVRKIIYAARTHSQLSQFVGELGRTAYADVRVVALGGRQVLCGNSSVNRPGRSEQSINDACLDLKKDKKSSCPLLSSNEGLSTLALHTLAQPSDIEDAAALGEASHACAYYASRVSGRSQHFLLL